jgi:hypothetical protein
VSVERFPSVAGHCPMGCGETLFLGQGGFVTCRVIGCSDPAAVSKLLEDREAEHVVVFDERGFTVRHPLRERLDDELLRCDLHRYCADLPGPPPILGHYRTVRRGDDWKFARIGGA